MKRETANEFLQIIRRAVEPFGLIATLINLPGEWYGGRLVDRFAVRVVWSAPAREVVELPDAFARRIIGGNQWAGEFELDEMGIMREGLETWAERSIILLGRNIASAMLENANRRQAAADVRNNGGN